MRNRHATLVLLALAVALAGCYLYSTMAFGFLSRPSPTASPCDALPAITMRFGRDITFGSAERSRGPSHLDCPAHSDFWIGRNVTCDIIPSTIDSAASKMVEPSATIHVLYATDAIGCGVLGSMHTVQRHASRPVRFHVVVANGTPVTAPLPHGAIMHTMPELPFRHSGTHSRLSHHSTAWARFYLQDFLPRSASRVLYLDTDTLLSVDVAEIIDLPMKTAVAVVESTDSQLARWNGGAISGVDGSQPVHNDGVLLVDMTLWHEERWSEQLVALASNDTLGLHSNGDQLLFNILFAGSNGVTLLPLKWNIHNIGCPLPLPQMGPGIYHWSCEGKWWRHNGRNRAWAFELLQEEHDLDELAAAAQVRRRGE